MMKDIRIAAVVCRCPVGQVKHNLERTRYWTLRAKKRGRVWSASLSSISPVTATGKKSPTMPFLPMDRR